MAIKIIIDGVTPKCHLVKQEKKSCGTNRTQTPKKKPSLVYKRGCSVFTAVKVSVVDQGSSTVVFP